MLNNIFSHPFLPLFHHFLKINRLVFYHFYNGIGINQFFFPTLYKISSDNKSRAVILLEGLKSKQGTTLAELQTHLDVIGSSEDDDEQK